MTTSAASDTVLRRIRGLLDQAERTSFPSEAEAFAAKAAEMMARHHVDVAMLERTRRERGGGVVEVDVELGRGQYVRARLELLGQVAEAYDCRVLTSSAPRGRVGHVIGHAADVEQTELMYTSLLVQATRAAAAEPVPRGHAGVTFRRGFLLGFAARVGERLAAQAARAARHAEQEHADGDPTAPSVALVLADRRQSVDDWVADRYRHLRRLDRAAPVSTHAVERGTRAGDRADLGGRAVDGGRAMLPG
ncbi:DUF2786 domain-containing protein [Actinomarinicola tropica]|uniref:DUF2786 domain-containing protein n=1 Tax=Actinomarinicola tropica TaxID=2789776 RepID=A0A5Q2RJI7_9ACTN|nr:DUF2786 domain-containing protein [Actinomarinicola tropica]QGG94721.1 DUF2786 domain-containing protein [Actinomarinicola tropica]